MRFNFRTFSRQISGSTTVAALLLTFLAAASSQLAAADHGQTVLVVGDSLSAGHGIAQEESWVALLGERLRTEGYGYAVVNASITGDTTTGGRKRLPRALKVHRPAVVIIELGGNDGLRGTPIAVMRSNLAGMIELSEAAGAHVVLAGMQIPTNYGGPYTRDFAAVYPELATKYGTGLIGFFLDGIALDITLFQADGIHPTAAAQTILLDNVWPVLEPKLAKPTTGVTSASQKPTAATRQVISP
ncbi:MAG: arylesterase [Chromatiales bacterium]|nr:MAG: arylesterase [Chromatiales bacterium]